MLEFIIALGVVSLFAIIISSLRFRAISLIALLALIGSTQLQANETIISSSTIEVSESVIPGESCEQALIIEEEEEKKVELSSNGSLPFN